MSNTALLLDSVFERHDPGPGHPESVARYKEISKVLKGSDYFKKCKKIKIRKASDSEILGCHTDKYLEIVKTEIGEGKSELSTGDTSICRDSLEVASYATGSVLEAIDLVLKGESKNGFCAIRPPGHHATADRGMGFCIFNNVAVGANYLIEKYKLKKIAIIDFDVHHGNGTQNIFYSNKKVLYISTHQYPHFPGTGASHEKGSHNNIFNIPLPAGMNSEEYFDAYEHVLKKLNEFKPEFILFSAGFDAHKDDPLSNINLKSKDYFEITKRTLIASKDYCKGNVVSILEGGYDLNALAESTEEHIKALIEF